MLRDLGIQEGPGRRYTHPTEQGVTKGKAGQDFPYWSRWCEPICSTSEHQRRRIDSKIYNTGEDPTDGRGENSHPDE